MKALLLESCSSSKNGYRKVTCSLTKQGNGKYFLKEKLSEADCVEQLPFVVKTFADTHCHLFWMGQLLGQLRYKELGHENESLQEFRDRLFSSRDLGLLYSYGWNEEQGLDRSDTLKSEFLNLFSGRAVYWERACGHAALVSPKVFELFSVPLPLDQTNHYDPLLTDEDLVPLRRKLEEHTKEYLEDYFLKAQEELERHNISAVGEMSLDLSQWELLEKVAKSQDLKTKICGIFVDAQNDSLVEKIDSSEKFFYNDELKAPYMKWFLDGSIGARTASLQSPYSDRPDCHGELYWSDKLLEERVAMALDKGFLLAFHAIGDGAIDQILRVVQPLILQKKSESGSQSLKLKHRIEHAQVIRPEQIASLKQDCWHLALQPVHWFDDKKIAFERFGHERLQSTVHRLRSISESGIDISLGTDAPIASIDPVKAMNYSAALAIEGEGLIVEHALWRYSQENFKQLGFEVPKLNTGDEVFLLAYENGILRRQ